MSSAILASCEIMPHDIVVVMGDIHFDGLMLAVVLIVWLIGKKR